MASFWYLVLGDCPQADVLAEIRQNALLCECRRVAADYDTGTIPEASAVVLQALCAWYRPAVIAEIGTFIGTSAMAMLGASSVKRIHTCDSRNDCGPAIKAITTYPRTRSTAMLARLVTLREKVDLFFFDGRIKPPDVPLIQQLSTPKTVYAFDDYEGEEKGVVNARVLQPIYPTHRLHEPPADVWGLPSRSTVAVLAP